MNDAVTLRPARASDQGPLGRLGAALMGIHHHLDAGRFMSVTPETAPGYGAYLVDQLLQPDALIIVAERDSNVIGYVFAKLEDEDYMALRGPAGVIHDLVVEPECRRQGIGRQLLDVAITALSAQGAPRIVLSAAARNAGAQRLFANRGFRPSMIEMTMDAPESPPMKDTI